MTAQGELFPHTAPAAPAPWPSDFALWPEVVRGDEEQALATAIDAAPLAPFEFHGWEGRRLTASYGSRYDFARGLLARAPDFPEWLRTLAGRLARHAGLAPQRIAQGLLIRYDPGAGIGWHRDRPQFGTVLGLSLDSAVTLRLRRRTPSGFERCRAVLPPRSLYRLEGAARWEWEHSIAPVEAVRRSITLRTLRAADPAA